MFKDKTIVLGVTGSIAAYKAAEITSKLVQAGAGVEVVLTDSAQKFITPLSFRSLTNRQPVTSMWEPASDVNVKHVSLANAADAILIAPATANIIAKLAGGFADDMLSCTVLATRAPVIVAPAMNCNMWDNPVTQQNIKTLQDRGFILVGPETGYLACGTEGRGRLAPVDQILAIVGSVLNKKKDLAGKTFVVTTGGTREPLDPVRFIGNRSSGKMGYAMAAAARDRGAMVKLISTVELPETAGMEVTRVQTAAEMLASVKNAVKGADALIMAAAVADFRPSAVANEKIKKTSAALDLKLEPTTDILAEIRGKFVRIGFAAETSELIDNAERKLDAKNLDIIVANDVTAPGCGFGSDTNKVTLIFRDGHMEDLPLMSKREVADAILDKTMPLLAPRRSGEVSPPRSQ
ncbi:bifunctional phosphopantothenoylcysteine decarboxylase/phosphopantothenate--cysteine ligase CoaBC [Dehalogenimonas etheniformans]|uniref:Coenzyme A biosynthesis bifunctional protein CoaBC n=1 Tax=Dehalogenimonas etheniformans TaxID=1536648 RepID=A0A2P5P5C0_9CHLR|nr:bifunctional phosphopantothenoylcysteine decarboxylase/phosphopantothenate--cysteine ligase CoaBC [Dehalogenimonas etheniformans]PPD57499.1 bifunctional phosphopantothenoylcysteine decarboxylase/phosphopantothenate--cysteine ligase CoaBC [Dehalogenimonas etheniformans]QNT76861.1 bifunctional phosphopantothenoylcysteine decarboxylase/phosphopantothenate--cysteine ligase CoaBC [Dehalogenimonas etheniformans]